VEFSETCQCSVCCVKVIHWYIILERSSALETRTMTCGQATRVQLDAKVAGGTATVLTPTWTATTTTPATTHHHRTMTVWCGFTGRATTIRWDSLKWSSDRFICELNNNNFIRADDIARRRRYHDHCVTMFVLCGCVCGHISTIKGKPMTGMTWNLAH